MIVVTSRICRLSTLKKVNNIHFNTIIVCQQFQKKKRTSKSAAINRPQQKDLVSGFLKCVFQKIQETRFLLSSRFCENCNNKLLHRKYIWSEKDQKKNDFSKFSKRNLRVHQAMRN